MARKKINWNGEPPPPNGPGRHSSYTFKGWKVGRTETFPADEYTTIRNAVGNLNRDKRWNFRYAQVTERKRDRIRVWRVK